MDINNKIYKMDCLEGMDNLFEKHGECMDLVVTDPPYPVISGGKPKHKGQPSGMLSKNDGKIFKHNNIDIEEWLPKVYRLLKEGSHCYIFTNTINLAKMINTCEVVGFKLHNILVWKKQNSVVNRWYMKNGEYVLFLRKGKAKPINNVSTNTVHEFTNPVGNKLHPTEKPVDLLKMYIENSSNKGDLVFDPFIGSGSTAIACLESDRKYVGFEIDEKYYNISIERINRFNE